MLSHHRRPAPHQPGNLIALRGRIHAAARTAAEGRATTYHATDSTITIGIRGPDAADRINQLRHALASYHQHGWTTRDQPRYRPGRRRRANSAGG